jgi:hypothetical protein
MTVSKELRSYTQMSDYQLVRRLRVLTYEHAMINSERLAQPRWRDYYAVHSEQALDKIERYYSGYAVAQKMSSESIARTLKIFREDLPLNTTFAPHEIEHIEAHFLTELAKAKRLAHRRKMGIEDAALSEEY